MRVEQGRGDFMRWVRRAALSVKLTSVEAVLNTLFSLKHLKSVPKPKSPNNDVKPMPHFTPSAPLAPPARMFQKNSNLFAPLI